MKWPISKTNLSYFAKIFSAKAKQANVIGGKGGDLYRKIFW